MDSQYVIRNALKFVYSALRGSDRFVDGAKSHYEDFFEKLYDGLKVPQPQKAIGEVESFYLGNINEDDFIQSVQTKLVNAADITPLFTVAWDTYTAILPHAQISKRLTSVSGRLLWEMFLKLDDQSILRVHIDDICYVILRIFRANGHEEREENIREWFCEEVNIDFWSFLSALLEKYSDLLKPYIIQQLHETVTKEVLMEGLMTKKGHRVHNWKERYFILKESSLAYFGESNEQKGSIRITDSTQLESMEATKNHQSRFKITDGVTGVVTEFSAPNDQTLQKWMDAIKLAVRMHHVVGRNFLHRLKLAKQSLPPNGIPPAYNGTRSPRERPSSPAVNGKPLTPVHQPLSVQRSLPLDRSTKTDLSRHPLNSSQSVDRDSPLPQPINSMKEFAEDSLNDAPPVPPRRFIDDGAPDLRRDRKQGVPRRAKKIKTKDDEMEEPIQLRRRHSSIMAHSDLPDFNVEHVEVDSGVEYAVVTTKKKNNIAVPKPSNNQSTPDVKRKPANSPRADRKKQEPGYIQLHFHNDKLKFEMEEEEMPRDVKNMFPYSQVVFDREPKKDPEKAQEMKRKKPQPTPPPKYEGHGMSTKYSDSNIIVANPTQNSSKKQISLPELTSKDSHCSERTANPPRAFSPRAVAVSPLGKIQEDNGYVNVTFPQAPPQVPPRVPPRQKVAENAPPVPARKTS